MRVVARPDAHSGTGGGVGTDGRGVPGTIPPMPPPVPPDLPGLLSGEVGGFRFLQAAIISLHAVSNGDSVVPEMTDGGGGVTGRRVVPPNPFILFDGTVGSTPSGATDDGFGVTGVASLALSIVVDEVATVPYGSMKFTIIRRPFPNILSSAITRTIALLPCDVITVPGFISVSQ